MTRRFLYRWLPRRRWSRASCHVVTAWRSPLASARLAAARRGAARSGPLAEETDPTERRSNAAMWDDLSTERGVRRALTVRFISVGDSPESRWAAARLVVAPCSIRRGPTPSSTAARGRSFRRPPFHRVDCQVPNELAHRDVCVYRRRVVSTNSAPVTGAQRAPGCWAWWESIPDRAARGIGVEVQIRVENNEGRPLREEIALIGRPAVLFRRHF